MKAKRQAALLELLRSGAMKSQAEAVGLLAARGIRATQGTVSRDLDELGAVRSGGNYVLLDTSAGSEYGAPLAQVLRDFVVSRSASGSIAVLRTPPGHASMVAAALDRSDLDGILGTVAGDDTLFVCGDERQGGRGVLDILDRVEKQR